MFETIQQQISNDVYEYQITEHQQVLSYARVIEYWQNAKAFRSFFIEILKSSAFEGYFWESRPVVKATLAEAYKFVLVKSTYLPRLKADTFSFKEHFNKNKPVVSFKNLGGDAVLVVPCPIGNLGYPHLATFIHTGPNEQLHEFWQVVGKEAEKRINEQPMWLSTAGMGVSWLHVRLDDRPKYYRYRGYKVFK